MRAHELVGNRLCKVDRCLFRNLLNAIDIRHFVGAIEGELRSYARQVASCRHFEVDFVVAVVVLGAGDFTLHAKEFKCLELTIVYGVERVAACPTLL